MDSDLRERSTAQSWQLSLLSKWVWGGGGRGIWKWEPIDWGKNHCLEMLSDARDVTGSCKSLLPPLAFPSASGASTVNLAGRKLANRNVCRGPAQHHKAAYSTEKRVVLRENILIICTLALVMLQHNNSAPSWQLLVWVIQWTSFD